MAPTETLTFNADPGQIYYVSCIVSPRLEDRIGRPLAFLTKLSMGPAEGKRGVYEMRGAKLLPQIIYRESARPQENNSE